MKPTDEVDVLGARFEAKLSGLRGRRLLAVDYWDVHNFSSEPARWDYGDWHHAVMGVGLGTDAGPTAGSKTSSDWMKRVRSASGPMPVPGATGTSTCERRFARPPLIGSDWNWDRAGEPMGASSSPRAVDVPMAVRLDFAAGAVWFVAAMPESPEWQRVFVGGDEIMVVFSAEKMLGMGFGDTPFLR